MAVRRGVGRLLWHGSTLDSGTDGARQRDTRRPLPPPSCGTWTGRSWTPSRTGSPPRRRCWAATARPWSHEQALALVGSALPESGRVLSEHLGGLDGGAPGRGRRRGGAADGGHRAGERGGGVAAGRAGAAAVAGGGGGAVRAGDDVVPRPGADGGAAGGAGCRGRSRWSWRGTRWSAGSPRPDPYLRAAQLLGVDPGRCVAIEDSPTGVASGEAAGCRVVACPHMVPIPAAPGRSRVASLAEVDLAVLARVAAGHPVDDRRAEPHTPDLRRRPDAQAAGSAGQPGRGAAGAGSRRSWGSGPCASHQVQARPGREGHSPGGAVALDGVPQRPDLALGGEQLPLVGGVAQDLPGPEVDQLQGAGHLPAQPPQHEGVEAQLEQRLRLEGLGGGAAGLVVHDAHPPAGGDVEAVDDRRAGPGPPRGRPRRAARGPGLQAGGVLQGEVPLQQACGPRPATGRGRAGRGPRRGSAPKRARTRGSRSSSSRHCGATMARPARGCARRRAGRRGVPARRARGCRGRRPRWGPRAAGRWRGSGTAAGTA